MLLSCRERVCSQISIKWVYLEVWFIWGYLNIMDDWIQPFRDALIRMAAQGCYWRTRQDTWIGEYTPAKCLCVIVKWTQVTGVPLHYPAVGTQVFSSWVTQLQRQNQLAGSWTQAMGQTKATSPHLRTEKAEATKSTLLLLHNIKSQSRFWYLSWKMNECDCHIVRVEATSCLSDSEAEQRFLLQV